MGDILWREEYICMDEMVDIWGEEVFLYYRRGNGCLGKFFFFEYLLFYLCKYIFFFIKYYLLKVFGLIIFLRNW